VKKTSVCPQLFVRRSVSLILALTIAGWLLMIATACGVMIAGEGIGQVCALAELALRWCLT